MQYGGGPINWDSERGRPSDMRQWAQMQKQWSTEKAGPALPLWTAEQLRAAGVRTAQPMSFGQADQQFRAASAAMQQAVNPSQQQYQQSLDAYNQARMNLEHAQAAPWQGGPMSQQQRAVMEGNRNFTNMQIQAAAQQAFYGQGPMTAQRVQAINQDPFYAQRFQQTYMQTPQMRYGGSGPSMNMPSAADQALMNRKTW
jgi:hypothetical protein